MTTAMDVLIERGFVQDVSDGEGLAQAMERPIAYYSGFDPTANSLHVGHLLSVMTMRVLQRCGHVPIALVGGGTARIGDPSGKTVSRPILSGEEIDANGAGFREQLSRYLDLSPGKGLLVDNKDWLLSLQLIPFLREIGRHFSVNQMLAAEIYKTRLETGLSFLEFNYVLLQSYDFLHLYNTQNCLLYIGGSDQWSNALSGVDLIRREKAGKAFTFVTPLLTTASGQKMGKTEAGAVWLDPTQTSPYDFYQFWVNTDDRDVQRFLGFFTDMPMDEVRALGALQGSELRQAKDRLAYEATVLCHGREAAETARSASHALFGGSIDPTAAPTVALDASKLQGLTAGLLLVYAGLCDSRNAARRLVEQGGASIDGEKVLSVDDPVEASAVKTGVLLRAGKKRYVRVIVEGVRHELEHTDPL